MMNIENGVLTMDGKVVIFALSNDNAQEEREYVTNTFACEFIEIEGEEGEPGFMISRNTNSELTVDIFEQFWANQENGKVDYRNDRFVYAETETTIVISC